MTDESQPWTTSIHILDDDSLLNIFYLYRPIYQSREDSEEIDEIRISNWCWWYKPAQICRRWRGLILRSASYLGLCLLCTNGTPVADMLAHSPPFPLVINFIHILHDRDITAEDEEGIVFALQQRNRVRHIHFRMPIRNLRKFIMTIDEEYSMLESLVMLPPTGDNSTNLTLPQTFRAPHLQRLVLGGFAFPTRSPLRTTVIGRLVTLRLYLTNPSAYFQPNILLEYLSAMTQLEKLVIGFFFPVPNRDVERQLLLTPIRTHVTLPSLRHFTFQGVGTYLEALVYGITTPCLEGLEIVFFNQLIYFLPRLLQFMRKTASLKFHEAEIEFSSVAVRVGLYPRDGGEKWAFRMDVDCEDLDWQVSSVAEISDALSQAFSTVERLTLGVGKGNLSPDTEEVYYVVGCTPWHRLLSSFGNVKTLVVDSLLVAELSRYLLSDNVPFWLLPKLQQLIYSGVTGGDAFRPFIDSRQTESRPVTLIRYGHGYSNKTRTMPIKKNSKTAAIDLPQNCNWEPVSPVVLGLMEMAASDSECLLRLATDGTVSSGNLEGLVFQVITDIEDPPRSDRFIATFLTIYQLFATSERLFHILKRRFVSSEPDPVAARSRYRILLFIESWIKKGFADEDLKCTSMIKELVLPLLDSETISEKMEAEAKEIARLINDLDCVRLRQPINCTALRSEPAERPQGVTATDLAAALTVVEGDRFKAITYWDYVNFIRWPPNGRRIEVFNVVHDLVKVWVQTTILESDFLEERMEMYEEWISTAKACRTLNNFSTTSAIVIALISPLIRALALTCESKAKLDLYTLAKELTPTDGVYENTLQNVATKDLIPWLELHLSTLNSSFARSDPIVETDGHPLIDFNVCSEIAKQIDSLVQYSPPLTRNTTRLDLLAYVEYSIKSRRGDDVLRNAEERSARLAGEERVFDAQRKKMIGLGLPWSPPRRRNVIA